MPSNEVSNQLNDYLPGMTPPKVKQLKPHQMTPEQFAAHPYAVFRSTHLPEGQELDTSKSFWPGGGVHLGTEQAALDRHRATSFRPNYEGHYSKGDEYSSDARLYTYWHKPDEEHLNNIARDSEENDIQPGTRYYSNKYEDPGKISLVTTETNRLKTHSDYVKEAISRGKGHEVPAKTMEMYRQGALGRGAWLPRAHTEQFTQPASEEENYGYKQGRSYASPINLPHKDSSGQVFSEKDINDFHGEDGWYNSMGRENNPRVSENGPDIHRLREQLAKDTKKGA